jgi:hypothetical protein
MLLNKLMRYAVLGLVALVALIAAEPPPREEVKQPEIKVCVIALLATDRNEQIDERVSCIAKAVKRMDPKLTGFQVHKMMSQTVAVGGRACFNVIADQTVGVTIDQGADADNRVQMKIEPPLLGEITYETCCGKFLPIVTRYRTADGQQLIIAVRVQPCQCK